MGEIAEGEKMTSQEKYEAQAEYCKENNAPLFAPSPRGCFKCRRDIWEKISDETAATTLITGCPYCCYSYCE